VPVWVDTMSRLFKVVVWPGQTALTAEDQHITGAGCNKENVEPDFPKGTQLEGVTKKLDLLKVQTDTSKVPQLSEECKIKNAHCIIDRLNKRLESLERLLGDIGVPQLSKECKVCTVKRGNLNLDDRGFMAGMTQAPAENTILAFLSGANNT